jgi:D-3-phosphoglycerate dehydrogenase
MSFRVVYTDFGFEEVSTERSIIEEAGGELIETRCRTADEVLSACRDADAVLVQWAPMPAEVIDALEKCRIIVRVGIGLDNVDLEAASRRRITVCNVPDYCIDEVADHAMALALSLARDLFQVDHRIRSGTWKITPISRVASFSEMTFGTVGFGRIARAVHQRAAAFGFRGLAFDPQIKAETMQQDGVEKLDLDALFSESDILSLHAPLTAETHHIVAEPTLSMMKSNALLVNTSRGALINGNALAHALNQGRVGGAGLDVFETEPLPEDHPLRKSPNTILTSHMAWYSEQSVPRLQRLAAEEVARFMTGQPPRNPVNKTT